MHTNDLDDSYILKPEGRIDELAKPRFEGKSQKRGSNFTYNTFEREPVWCEKDVRPSIIRKKLGIAKNYIFVRGNEQMAD